MKRDNKKIIKELFGSEFEEHKNAQAKNISKAVEEFEEK